MTWPNGNAGKSGSPDRGGNPVAELQQLIGQARQEKEELINEARRDYNKVIPLAEGEKDQPIREADGHRLKRIAENTTLVLSTESELFKFLKGMDPHLGATP